MRLLPLACLLVLGCRQDRADTSPDSDAAVVLGACEAPADRAEDTLAVLTSLDLNAVTKGGQTHVVRIAVDEAGGILYGGGFGGIYAVDVSGDTPALAGELLDMREPFHLARRDPSTLVVSNREVGWAVVDVSDPAAMRRIAGVPGVGFGPVAFAGETLLIASEVLNVVDLADRTAPKPLGRLDGFELPVGIVVSGDRAYVADAEAGLVVVDLADPTVPVRLVTIPTAGTPQAITLGDGWLAVAQGSAGVELFDLADPAAPASLAQVVTGGPAVGVHARGGVLAVAAHDGLTLVDVTVPAQPRVIGFEATGQWSMAPHLFDDGRALLAEWNLVDVVGFDPADHAPQVDPTPSSLYCPGPEEAIVVHNRGGSDLRLVGASVDDPRFTFSAEADVVPAGGSVPIHVTFADDGAPTDASLCLATDDPDEPVVQIGLTTVSEALGVALCEAAPDFSLPDLDGITRSLVEERGIPVLILFFSTW